MKNFQNIKNSFPDFSFSSFIYNRIFERVKLRQPLWTTPQKLVSHEGVVFTGKNYVFGIAPVPLLSRGWGQARKDRIPFFFSKTSSRYPEQRVEPVVARTHTRARDSFVGTHSSVINRILLKFLFLEGLICAHVALCKKLAEYMIAAVTPTQPSTREAIVPGLISRLLRSSSLQIFHNFRMYNYCTIIIQLLIIHCIAFYNV